jgi:hypothetical protein
LFNEGIVYEDNVLGLDVLCAVLVEQLESLAQGNEFLKDGLFRFRDVLHCVVVAAERLSRAIATLEDAVRRAGRVRRMFCSLGSVGCRA